MLRVVIIAKSMLCVVLACVLAACVVEETRNGKPVNTTANKQSALADYVSLANGYLQEEKRDKALIAIKKGMEIDDESPGILNALAFYYAGDKEFDLADKTFRKAISADKSYTGSYLNYGSFLFAQKKYEEACEMFKTAADDALYLDRSAAFYNWGVCLKQTGKIGEALAAFGRSLDSDPKNTDTLLELALIKFESGEFSRSRDYYEKYLKEAKQTPASLWLGIRLMHVFHEKDKLAGYAMYLKNEFPTSKECLEYNAWQAAH